MIKDINIVSVSNKSIENLIVVDLMKGSNLASVIFDTGASISVLNKTTADNFEAIETEKKVTGGGTAGNVSEIELSTFEEVKIGDYTIPKSDFIVVEDKVLHFGQDEKGNELIIDGFLGWDIISKLRWEYNHEKLELRFGEPSYMSYENSILDDWDNMPILNVILDGQKRVFGFDSGHTESVIGNLLYPKYEHLDSKSDDFVGIDGQNKETVKIAETFEMDINNSKVSLTNISVINRNLFPSKREDICGLLGIDIVENRSWILDYSNRYFEVV
ncbi:MAG: retropepsin-like domain-containing protein [Clostridiales bacterium]|nr:retropepsin-like domain-containing protein [Clostridiales bacterium]